MKVIYFDVANNEETFFKERNQDKYNYFLDKNSINELNPIKKEYIDADVISLFTSSRVSNKVLEQFKNLKLIALRSVGFNHIDIDYCKSHNINVVNAPNYGNITVAEFALALLLDVCRKVTISNTKFKSSCVSPAKFIGTELNGKTIGIVGLGAIGSAFARICHGLGMKIIVFDKVQNEKIQSELGLNYVSFNCLLKSSDFISIHMPLTKDNYHMFDSSCFSKMKSSAIIINTGRGEIIDSKALYDAIINKQIAGAGLDVLEKEDTINDCDFMIGINRLDKFTLEQTLINNQLFKLENVIITPHIAFNSKEAIRRILEMTMFNIDQFKQGKLVNSVI